jgi:endonuclease YncB( thermonuclease family)
MAIKIHFEPEIVKRGKTRFERVEDGDTLFIKEGIRMLGIDTPEIHFPGTAKPSNHDASLNAMADKLTNMGVIPGLAAHLKPRLKGQAGTLQLAQGDAATQTLAKAVDDRLAQYSTKTGKRISDKDLYIQIASDVFDHYGRMLAYLAPTYTKTELDTIPPAKRPTFNLQMLQLGWAAPIIIFPNIPKKADLALVQSAVKKARNGKKGAWADPNLLLGYEFRSCVRLYKGEKEWISRYCVDMTSCKIYEPQDYYRVDPENRIFVWPADLAWAIDEMNLDPQFATVPTDVIVG